MMVLVTVSATVTATATVTSYVGKESHKIFLVTFLFALLPWFLRLLLCSCPSLLLLSSHQDPIRSHRSATVPHPPLTLMALCHPCLDALIILFPFLPISFS
ncbi:hypothetical protein QBC37DRAFT_414864 [Rhypophila decipiens]|uniref:Uncharacterized protein n=1 Tax=Rhypophila decipiens TaxID=261697 RepID=A0AAN6YFW4_9PEZI|nr:hypothetical protein QBC37DRAFT_414864 [Rhypophila decipiens]